MVMESSGDNDCPHPSIHGTRVVTVKRPTPGVDENHPYLSAFDFSRQGWGILPVHDEGFGAERRATFKDGRSLSLQGDQWMGEWRFDSLGDGRLVYLVSCFRCWKVVRH